MITEIAPYLNEDVPMFTQKLYNGVGYAEDPGKGISFGMSRSTVIAEALVDSFLKNESKKEQVESAIRALSMKGMAIDRLHLNKHTALTPKFPKYE